LVDDTRFARAWIENRNEFRPRSRRALSIELRQHGLDEDIAAEALAEIDDEALAYQAAIRQSGKLKNWEWPDFRRKLTGFLGRRGFNYEVISTVVKRVWDETQSERTVE
jgi:regulatory protein